MWVNGIGGMDPLERSMMSELWMQLEATGKEPGTQGIKEGYLTTRLNSSISNKQVASTDGLKRALCCHNGRYRMSRIPGLE